MLAQLFKLSLNLQKTIFFWFLFFYLIAPAFSSNTNPYIINNSPSSEVGQSSKSDNKSASISSYNIDYKLIAPIINLTVIADFGIAQLSWSTTDPALVGSYFIDRDAATSGTWTTIAQVSYNTSPLQYSDTISYPYCSLTSFSYRIRFVTFVPADTVVSDTVNVTLSDITPPDYLKDDILSININNNPELKWTPIVGDDILEYWIRRKNVWQWFTIDTVPANATGYIDQKIDGCSNSYSYVITTIDKCGLPSIQIYEDNSKQTINLIVPPIDDCERLAKLTWNKYLLMPGGLGGYKVWRRIDSGNPIVYGTPIVIKTITDTLLTTYTDAYQFAKGNYYNYFVEAFGKTGSATSSSCWQGWKYSGYNLPDSIYITTASVQDDSYVRVSFHSSPDSTVKKLILERSLDLGASFSPIDSLVFATDFIPKDFFIDDATAEVHIRSYDYRLVAIDYCGTRKILSNVARSICLKCEGLELSNDLFWNTYQTWQKGVSGYEVFRTTNGQPTNGETIGNINAGSNTLSDPLTSIDPNKKACYWVVASENPGNPYLSQATSLSNTCCINKAASLFMPNAFCPEGINNRYRPVALYVNPVNFTMTIFNRWGQQIFETTDMISGWDGRVNKELSLPGLYAYIIKYSSVGGEAYTKRGTFLLIR
jgi:gliding motility-associated-like protein